MSSARRPLLTAAAAGSLLCGLWFVPSANATADGPARNAPSNTASPQVTEQARVASSGTAPTGTADTGPAVGGAEVSGTRAAGSGAELADTGSFDSTPYVVGGTAFLTLGAGFVVYSVRRERLGF